MEIFLSLYIFDSSNYENILEMQTISDLTVLRLKGNHKALGRLVVLFNRHYRSIEMWIAARDVRLATPSAIKIIKEETGLSESEILTEAEIEKVEEDQN